MTQPPGDLDEDLAAILRAGEARPVRRRLRAGIIAAILALVLLGGLYAFHRHEIVSPAAPRLTAAASHSLTSRPA